MPEITLRSPEYPKVQLTRQDIDKALAAPRPAPVRNNDGTLDRKATLAISPITKILAEKERKELEKKGLSLYSRTLESLDAFERRLYAEGLTGDSTMDVALGVFYRPDNKYLFPEYVERAVFLSEFQLSADEVSLTDLLASVTNVTSNSVKMPELAMAGDAAGDKKMRRTSEGASKRTYEITESDNVCNLADYGFALKIQDKAKQSQTLDQISVITEELAAEHIVRAGVQDALAVLLAGGYTSITMAGTSLVWEDIIRFFYPVGGNPSRTPDFLLTCDDATGAKISLVKILNLAMLTDPIAIPGVAVQDIIPKIRGRNLKFLAGDTLKNKLVGIKKSLALRMFENRGIMQSEWERIAEGGFDVYHYTTNRGFYRVKADAVRVLIPGA